MFVVIHRGMNNAPLSCEEDGEKVLAVFTSHQKVDQALFFLKLDKSQLQIVETDLDEIRRQGRRMNFTHYTIDPDFGPVLVKCEVHQL